METLRTKENVFSSLYGISEYVIDQEEKIDMMKYPNKKLSSLFLSSTPSEPIKQRYLGSGYRIYEDSSPPLPT